MDAHGGTTTSEAAPLTPVAATVVGPGLVTGQAVTMTVPDALPDAGIVLVPARVPLTVRVIVPTDEVTMTVPATIPDAGTVLVPAAGPNVVMVVVPSMVVATAVLELLLETRAELEPAAGLPGKKLYSILKKVQTI